MQVGAWSALWAGFWVLGLSLGQSDFLCPPNNKMGLCEDVTSPCYDNTDCPTDEVCCPEACSRACKPKMAPGQSSQVMAEVPDLLNDPRVYIGKCPDASCFSLFSSEPDQCSTSSLCRPEQFCCHNGCKNVCLWKPPYAALIAKQEARVRQQQQILYQQQQAELRKQQEAARRERQRKLAELEQARRSAQARAEAEAVLAAQRAKADYEAKVKAATAAQAEVTSKLQQQMAQQQAAALLQQQRQTSNTNTYNNVPPPPTSSSSSTKPSQTDDNSSVNLGGFFNALKKDRLAGTLANQINSPANYNPYTSPVGGANALDKRGYSGYTSDKSKTRERAVSAALARLILPASSQSNQYNKAGGNVAPPPALLATPTFSNLPWSRGAVNPKPQVVSYQAATSGSSMSNQYNQQPRQQLQQQQQQQGQQAASPYLFYHFLQAA